MLKRTPLFAAHQRLGGKLIEFGGWEMPVQYTSIMDEHQTVRQAAGLFDISHMGEVLVFGSGALPFLNGALTNDLSKLVIGQGQYTLMCNAHGGVIDDLYAYRLALESYLLIINASRIDADVPWLEAALAAFPDRANVTLQDVSGTTGAVALQGPKSPAFINELVKGPALGGTLVAAPAELKKNQIASFDFGGTPIWIGRTGYTGEDGFEVIAPGGTIEAVWNQLITLGQPHGLKPAGLGARDTLRTEVCFPLYGHELDEQTTPIEAGLGVFVALEKGDFIGRSTLSEQKAKGVTKRLMAFKMTGKSAPPRPHYAVWSTDDEPQKIGEVVSGTQSPSLGAGIGLAYVDIAHAKTGTPIAIEIRSQKAAAEIVSKPFYRKAN